MAKLNSCTGNSPAQEVFVLRMKEEVAIPDSWNGDIIIPWLPASLLRGWQL